MFDEVSACVRDNECTEELPYVRHAAGQARGTIQRAVNLVDEGCRLRGGTGE